MNERSIRTLTALACILAGVATGASFWFYASNRERLHDARQLVASCQTAATHIQRLRETPQTTTLTSRSVEDLGTTVEVAATDAKLAKGQVLRIDPQPPKRLAKTDYLEQSTDVELVAVNLQQLINFLSNLNVGESELGLNTLRLQVPHSTSNSSGTEQWSADIVLTQRIYAPTPPHR